MRKFECAQLSLAKVKKRERKFSLEFVVLAVVQHNGTLHMKIEGMILCQLLKIQLKVITFSWKTRSKKKIANSRLNSLK